MIKLDLNHCSIPLLRALAKECRNEEDIKRILEFNEGAVYKTVASNEYAGDDTLRYLYAKYGEEVEWTLAENETTPQDVLHEIATEASEGVAKVLLGNSKLQACDIDVIVERYDDEEKLVEKAINHENISAATLIKIASRYPGFAEDILRTGKVKFVES